MPLELANRGDPPKYEQSGLEDNTETVTEPSSTTDLQDTGSYLSSFNEDTWESIEKCQQYVTRELGRPSPPAWMEVMSKMNIGDKSDAKLISHCLYKYSCEKPWVMSESKIKQICDSLKRTQSSEGDRDGPPADAITSSLGKETLQQYTSRLADAKTGETDVRIGGATRISMNQMDDILGLAGFWPRETDSLRATDRQEWLRELKKHIRVASAIDDSILDISLEPLPRHNATGDDTGSAWNQERCVQCISRIMAVFERLETAMTGFERMEQSGCQFTYLRKRRVGSEARAIQDAPGGNTGGGAEHGIETATIETRAIKSVLDLVRKFGNEVQQESLSSWWPWTALANVATVMANQAAVLAFVASRLLRRLPLPIEIEIEETSESVDDVISKWADNVIAKVQETPGLPSFHSLARAPGTKQDDRVMEQKLHQIAITGQFLCLILQARTRGFETPFEFDGVIDRPITQIRLLGIDPKQPCVSASSKQVLCFPEKDLLVFDWTGEENLAVSTQGETWRTTQLVTTVGELMACLRTDELLIGGLEDSSGDKSSCVAVGMDAGYLLPDKGTSAHPRGLWRWWDARDIPPSRLQVNPVSVQIGLWDQIHVGLYHQEPLNRTGVGLSEAGEGSGQSMRPVQATPIAHRSISTTQLQDTSEAIEHAALSSSSQPSIHVPEANRRSSDPSPPSPQETDLEDKVGCDWTAEEAEESRRRSTKLRQVGTSPGQYTPNSRQAQLGIVATPVPVSGQVGQHWSQTPGRDILQILGEEDCLMFLNNPVVVLVSLHAGVTKRARIRDIAAGFAQRSALWSPDGIEDHAKRNVVRKLREFLEGQGSLSTFDGNRNILKDLVRFTIRTLRLTRIRWKKEYEALWPAGTLENMILPLKQNEWMRMLTDTEDTLSLACIVPDCFMTPECPCPKATALPSATGTIKWTCPSRFRLDTSVRVFKAGSSGELLDLKSINKCWVTKAKLGLVGTVMGSAGEGPDKVWFVSVKAELQFLHIVKQYTSITQN